MVSGGRARVVAAAIALVVAASRSGDAHAAGATPSAVAANRREVSVTFRGKPDPLPIEVYREQEPTKASKPVVKCSTPCTRPLPIGSYTLISRETKKTLEQRATIEVGESETIFVEPDYKSQRSGGLVLAMTGFALIGAGIPLLLSGCHSDENQTGGGGSSDCSVFAGLGMSALGLLMIPTGFVIFGNSFGMEVNAVRYSGQPAQAPRERRAAFSTPMLGFRGVF
jgi:hypothetical protein